MAYVTQSEVQNRLRADYIEYPEDISEHQEFAETRINGTLAGHFVLPFDNVANYASVPSQIKWIAAWLVGYSIWDQKTSLEGPISPDRGDDWKTLADEWLMKIISGEMSVTLSDGTLVAPIAEPGGPRFYPSGSREKADSDKNDPYFTRAQAGEW